MHDDDYSNIHGDQDDVETIVGPSVKVEGDFVSQGNVVIEGTVMGSVKTDKNLRVEEGAHIDANVEAQNVRIAGEVKGNVIVSGLLELTESAVVLGDVHTKTLVVAAGAIMHGNCDMKAEMGATKATKKSRTKKVRQAEDFEDDEDDLELEFAEEERELELA